MNQKLNIAMVLTFTCLFTSFALSAGANNTKLQLFKAIQVQSKCDEAVVSDLVNELMGKHSIGAPELAEAIGEPAKTAQEWAGTGIETLRKLDKIKKVADFFNVSTHFLPFGEEDPRSGIGMLPNKTEIHTGLYEITIRKGTEKKS